MDICDALKNDHLAALALARVMRDDPSATTAKQAYRDLREALTAHSRAEETVVYAALKKLSDEDEAVDLAFEGEVEHALCDSLIDQMARGNADGKPWRAKAQVVLELLQHHVQEEHETMFPLLKRHFSLDERTAMAQRFEKRKAVQATA